MCVEAVGSDGLQTADAVEQFPEQTSAAQPPPMTGELCVRCRSP